MTVSRTALLVIPADNTTLVSEMAALLPGYPRQLVARVPRPARSLEASDIPAYAEAMVAALEHNDAHHIAVVTPYLKAINDGLRAYLEQAGIEVDVLSSFECAITAALGAVTEREVLERAIATAGTMHDALFIACSQLPTLGVLGPLRARLGVPVWSSISATAWLAARHAPHAARLA